MKRSVVILNITNVILCIVLLYVGYKSLQYRRLISENRKEYDCLRGWTNSLESLHDTVDVVFLGNSITHGGKFDQVFPDKKVCNLGYPSDDLAGMRKRIPQVVAVRPKKVFMMGGANNIRHFDEALFETLYLDLIRSLRDSLPGATIILQSVLPINDEVFKAFGNDGNDNINKANEIIQKLAVKTHLHYIDLNQHYKDEEGKLDVRYTDDGIHLKEEAYNIWYKEIKAFIYD